MAGLGLGSALLTLPLSGQSMENAPPSGEVFVTAWGGLHPGDPGLHGFGGVEGGWARRFGPLGVQGVGLLGGGAGFRSGLVAGGISAGTALTDALDVRGWVGVGAYRESLAGSPEAAPRTQVPALLAGVSAGVPLGPIGIRVGVLAWTGPVTGDGVQGSTRPVGVRLLFGVTP
jgi:hypothetical protein